jgi:hypothetical protein
MNKLDKPIVFINLPKAGLGNKLIVWAHGIDFSERHNFENYVLGWFDIKIGPILRKEKKKRFYFGFFKNSKYDLLFFYKMIIFKKIYNPKQLSPNHKVVYIFDTLPEFPGYLNGIYDNRYLIREKFYDLIKPKHLNYLSNCKLPILSVHIRRSDFTKNDSLEVGSKCNTQTPLSYYINEITHLRDLTKQILPVTIFTDGYYDEIRDLLLLENVSIANENIDIIDLLLMANSQYIIPSPSSTFSLWAMFISNVNLKFNS